MFSFHKPKIYRSNLGCCICKAKSSSSRFTDSKKYENEFERCFRIQEKRSGEICNACVLLVKRWKKLSPENRITKHWHHVVDARAGPGTKLTGNRRLVGSSSSGSGGSSRTNSSNNNNNNIDSQDCSSSSNSGTNNVKQRTVLSNRVEVLPLSSRDQANNQASSSAISASNASSSNSSSSARRSNSFSNKARAIDTNVTTFTFGEPDNRRSYMSSSSYYATSPTSSSSHLSFAKPQSALNSSAFESVIKRFRQRQQQQQMAAQRRQQNRQQRLLQQQQQQQSPQNSEQQKSQKFVSRKQLPQSQKSEESSECSSQSEQREVANNTQHQPPQAPHLQVPPGKRLKRSSESINSVTIDGVKASSILDSSLWRKEKVCCGIIFRGLYNEVVVFPKLLKPCQCRTNALKLKLRATVRAEEEDEEEEELVEQQSVDSPPIRATKSGSISSCDSNTSGTGSMEPQLEDLQKKRNDQILNAVAKQRRKSNLRSLTSAAESGDESGVVFSGPLIAGDLSETASNVKQQQQQTPSTTIEPSRPRLLTSKRQNQQQQISVTNNKRTKRLNDNDSTISSSSSATLSSSRVASDSASQQAHSPGSSSDGSSSRLLLMADEDVALAMLDDEDIESNTDASSSVESIAEVERKKSSGVVGAMG